MVVLVVVMLFSGGDVGGGDLCDVSGDGGGEVGDGGIGSDDVV